LDETGNRQKKYREGSEEKGEQKARKEAKSMSFGQSFPEKQNRRKVKP
jgi:hypothetical protein